ncbi:helix-hairpin-helix domain-containing protein, partial [Vibrio parahaemolyticus]|nr:helix-hairpin-helix domain-containing protein [Vibrio parahaemolyticus]
GITNVGIKTARDLALNFKSLDRLMKANYEELISIKDIGDVVARNIIEFFNDDKIKTSLYNILKKGIEIQELEENKKETILSGKKVVITGSFESFKRSELSEILKEMGCEVNNSVSNKTDYLIVGSDPGSKLDKAQSLGINILNEEEIKKIIEEYLERREFND